MTELFKATEDNTPVENARELLVGEGKKFKDDEALARGKLESDRFIERLQSELQETRQELQTRLSLEEALAKLKEEPSNVDDNHQQERSPATMTPEEIDRLVQTKLEGLQTQTQKARNQEMVLNELSKVWGNNYQAKLNQRAEELDLGKEFLTQLALEKPKAFLKLVIGQETSPVNPNAHVPPSTNRNTTQIDVPEGKTFKHYEKLRKENPRLYYTPRVQAEIFQQAKRLGENFYK